MLISFRFSKLMINFNLLVFVVAAKKQNLKIYLTKVEDHIDQSLIALFSIYFFHIEINFSPFDKFTL